MSKYFSLFATEAQYEAAKETLDYPNVSLIDTTGDLHYSTYTGKEVADAPFGSILMAEVATNKLFYILNSDYNLTEYPLADFKPIAVCIYDKESNANNEAVFMSVQWVDYTALGQGKPSKKDISWGFNNFDLSTKVSGISDEGTNHISSRVLNTEFKPLVTTDYSGSSISNSYNNGLSASACCCWRYSTPGTSEGDWYFPSYYDMMKFNQNFLTITTVLTNIKNVAGSSYLNTINSDQWILGQYNKNMNRSYFIYSYGGFDGNNGYRYYNKAVRPVFIAGIEEL